MSLEPTAVVVTAIFGPVHFICTLGGFLLRDAPAFAVRVPLAAIGAMVCKMIAFGLQAWLLIDPYNCPCAVVPFACLADWTGNFWVQAKAICLLFRYEIQDALEKSRGDGSIVAFDEKNFFVRYRSILRPSTQKWVMAVILLWFVVGYSIILGVFFEDYGREPCTYDSYVDNKICLVSIIFGFISAGPLVVVSMWASTRLRRFPNDNWKMGIENTIFSGFTSVGTVACVTALIVVPTFNGILWVLAAFTIWGNFLMFLTPLYLHRRTLSKLSKLNLAAFATLDTLLQNEEFLDAFGNFLIKEFSSENLFFWLEVGRLRGQYHCFPEEKKDMAPEELEILQQAAKEFIVLGKRSVGADAPWQLNVSGFTVEAMEKSLLTLEEFLRNGSTEGLADLVQDTLITLTALQEEVYELLRKDPYPRFLLTTDAAKLNQNESFKRMLAAEKMEDEVNKTLGTKRGVSSGEGSRNSRSAEGSKKTSQGSKKSEAKKSTSEGGKKSKNDKKNQPSKLLAAYLSTSTSSPSSQSKPTSPFTDGSESEMKSNLELQSLPFPTFQFQSSSSSESSENSTLSEGSERRSSFNTQLSHFQ